MSFVCIPQTKNQTCSQQQTSWTPSTLQTSPIKKLLTSLLASIKYVITAISYGVMFALAILLIIPLFQSNQSIFSLFQPNQQLQAVSYARAVSVAAPSVVNIYSSKIQRNPRYGQNPVKATRLGSGVIMDSLGYILTNYHVVHNTDLIEVLLQSGQYYPAELVGFDVPTDLAVLKVNSPINLPVIPQRSDLTSLPGDVVLAIGNPLNFGQTVTQGIISATGRIGLSSTSYADFLQMDAAINNGNSGGALINTNGELVGINSRQVTDDKLNIQGIFLAIPYQLAAKVMKKIIAHGRVVRGWLGISTDRELNGVVIETIAPNSPAEKAGLLPGDRIYQIGENEINNIPQALDIVAETAPNTTILFKVLRKNSSIELPVTILEQKR